MRLNLRDFYGKIGQGGDYYGNDGFKSYVRKLLHMIDEATEKETKEEILAAVVKLKEELELDLQG